MAINGAAGGSGKLTVKEDGVELVKAKTLDFTGPGVSLTDNGNGEVEVNIITGAGGGGGDGYLTVEEEGAAQGYQFTTVNFIGDYITAADSGDGLTADVTVDLSSIEADITQLDADVLSLDAEGDTRWAELNSQTQGLRDAADGYATDVDLDAHTEDATLHFTEASIDHTAITNVGTNTHAQIDTHIADSTLHFTEASIDHTAITNVGTNTHAQIDTHVADSTLHFTEGSISHTNITDIGTNTHAQIDTHVADSTLHFTEGNIDHTAITNVGTNTHAQIDTHVADSTLHFTEGSIDHTAITNVGTNTHAQIDTHIADSTLHFTEGSIDHDNLQNVGANTHANIDLRLNDIAENLDGYIVGVQVEDDGVATVTGATTFNFAGAGVVVADAGANEATITIAGGGSGVDVEDEDVAVATATTLNFTGAGVTATDAGSGQVDVTIAGGGGGVTAAEGADGYVTFFTGEDSIAGDNDLFWDRANNYLGIHNESPAHMLDVDGDNDQATGVIGCFKVGNAKDHAIYTDDMVISHYDQTGNTNWAMRQTNTGVLAVNSTGGSLTLNIGATSLLRVSSSSYNIECPNSLATFAAHTSNGASDPGHNFDGDEDTGMFNAGANILGFSTGGTERFRIESDGGLFAYNLASDTGTTLILNGSNEICTDSSSRRYKQNIEKLEDTSFIHKLQPATYQFKNSPDQQRYGLVAEDTAKVNPVLVNHVRGKPESINVQAVLAGLVGEVQNLKKEIKKIKG